MIGLSGEVSTYVCMYVDTYIVMMIGVYIKKVGGQAVEIKPE